MKYIAFLRGINVGGRTKVEMTKLKKSFEDLGFTDVKTILNSGNVIFTSSKAPKGIEDQLKKVFGFSITVIIRDEKQIKKLIDKDPFNNIPLKPSTTLYVSFIDKEEIINVLDREKGVHTTEMMKELEGKYGKRITTRNWNTIQKIFKLLN